MTINEDVMHSACEFISQAKNSDWKRVIKNQKLVSSTTNYKKDSPYIPKRNITSKPTPRPYNIHT